MFLEKDRYTNIREQWKILLDNLKLANVYIIYDIYIIGNN